MTLGTAIYQACLAHAPLKALVGTRVYPLKAPSDIEGSHIIWQGVAGRPASTHGEPAQISHQLVQFACFASDYERAAAVRLALIAALDGVEIGTGDMPTLEDDTRDERDERGNVYRCDADFLI
jgi:hypothetical protein